MYRQDLPHIYELRDLLSCQIPATAYFQNLDKSLSENARKLRQYRDHEQELAGLDEAAWSFLKSKVKPLLLVKREQRGWQRKP